MDHLTLYDSAAMDLEETVLSAVVVGDRLLGSCVGLNTEMRDIDILSARVSRPIPAAMFATCIVEIPFIFGYH